MTIFEQYKENRMNFWKGKDETAYWRYEKAYEEIKQIFLSICDNEIKRLIGIEAVGVNEEYSNGFNESVKYQISYWEEQRDKIEAYE